MLDVDGSVSPYSAHQVLVRHVGNVLACFISGERWGGGGGRALLPRRLFSGPPDRADYGVL